MKMVVVQRLGQPEGVYDMADALRHTQKFQEKGVNAIAELVPGAPLEGINLFYIKVPEDQLLQAHEVIAEVDESKD